MYVKEEIVRKNQNPFTARTSLFVLSTDIPRRITFASFPLLLYFVIACPWMRPPLSATDSPPATRSVRAFFRSIQASAQTEDQPVPGAFLISRPESYSSTHSFYVPAQLSLIRLRSARSLISKERRRSFLFLPQYKLSKQRHGKRIFARLFLYPRPASARAASSWLTWLAAIPVLLLDRYPASNRLRIVPDTRSVPARPL
jgi:hypothetical protein